MHSRNVKDPFVATWGTAVLSESLGTERQTVGEEAGGDLEFFPGAEVSTRLLLPGKNRAQGGHRKSGAKERPY